MRSGSDDRRLKQLCREVYRVAAQVIPGETNDPILESVSVVDVQPAPDGSRLAIRLHMMEGGDPNRIIEHIRRLKGRLRAEIAAAVQRKRTPELVFELAPEREPDVDPEDAS